ncbi:MAG: DUF1501 domain-containing protein [Pirellulales bacterium]|nr:DUF1501 domain-containing protein [Pirellulales bacterium]
MNRDGAVGRRDFLRGIATVATAGSALNWADLVTAEAPALRQRGMACILLWMQGGPSQFETFSPKPGHSNGGETKAISTAVAGIQIADSYPEIAKQMKHLAIVRSMTSKEGAHPRATQLLHTGYLPMASVKYPTLGSLVAHESAERTSELPSFVRIGGGRNSGGGAGFLGAQYDPFDIGDANSPPTNATPATEVARFKQRLGLLDRLESAAQGGQLSAETSEHRQLYQRALKMILSPEMKAFDLSKEPEKLRDAYGRTQFGAGCLLARRLIESGVTFVEVALNGWDTHQDNFKRTTALSEQVDRPFAALLADLHDRGMIDQTLVIWMGEFGRTPRINPNGGRDHYPRAFNVALAGGGVRGGQTIGETDAGGNDVKSRPVTVHDLFQTFCKSLRIDATKENMSSIGRPIKIVDGGKPVVELFG